MNDTIRIANDSLNIVLSSSDAVAQDSSETTIYDVAYIFCVLAILIVIAASFYFIVNTILSSIKESREVSFNHEKDMLELNRIKEERKRLMGFCYDMSQKKESETQDLPADKSELSLNKVRQECWQIIKQLNGVNI